MAASAVGREGREEDKAAGRSKKRRKALEHCGFQTYATGAVKCMGTASTLSLWG